MPLNPATIEAIQALMARAGLTEADLREQFVLGSGSGGQK
ncbi:MAG TPA: peptide chain release factor-like protein, partial [Candidatus Spyradenecus faecavium]|nr:peptide chain release factor-like protein [Candidatus Spyradenecus faecavium]